MNYIKDLWNNHREGTITVIWVTLFFIHPLLAILFFIVAFFIAAFTYFENQGPKEKPYKSNLPSIDMTRTKGMYMSHEEKQEYLKSTKWKRLRSKVLHRDNYQCVSCNSKNNLNCHHIVYYRLGNENLEDLCVLCDICHSSLHKKLGYDRDGYYQPIIK